MVKLLSLDPSSSKTGYAVAYYKESRLDITNTGIIDIKKKEKPLHHLYERLITIVEEEKPDKILLETPFYSINAQTLIKLGEVRGIILLVSQIQNIEVEEFTPAEVKICITGYGRSSKEEVLDMVNRIYNINIDSYDIADAVALLHAFTMKVGV